MYLKENFGDSPIGSAVVVSGNAVVWSVVVVVVVVGIAVDTAVEESTLDASADSRERRRRMNCIGIENVVADSACNAVVVVVAVADVAAGDAVAA